MMARGVSRGGFTLVELMVTSAIAVVILGAVGSSFVGGIRLMKATFATSEMSLRSRDLRDRLLFRAAPVHDGTVWAGILSGTNKNDVLEGNATKILMYCPALKTSGDATANQTIQLVFRDYGSEKCRFYSEDRYDERWPHRWLNPGGLNLFADSRDTPPLAWAKQADNTDDKSRFYIRLSGRVDVAGLSVEHNERIVVPVFGMQQATHPDGKGGLDK